MEPFFWKESYNTGIKQIDRDHRNIVEMANALYNTIHSDNGGRSAILQNCQKIVDFTEEHFSREEKYMAASDFPGMEEHKIEHDRLKEEARKLLLRFELDTPGSATGLYYVLREMFIEHIPELDKVFGEYYLSKAKK